VKAALQEEQITTLSRSAMAALLAAPVVATLVLTVFVVLDVAGGTPLSYRGPSNVSEAAGMGLGSEVLRFLREGQDPRRIRSVRPDIISPNITQVTALEAAIWSRRIQLVRLLDRQGVLSDAGERARLACAARAIQLEDVERYLAPEGLSSCDPEALVGGIEARGR